MLDQVVGLFTMLLVAHQARAEMGGKASEVARKG